MIKSRNPFLVLIWSFGLYILVHTIQYLGYLFASIASSYSFDLVISGEFISPTTLLTHGMITGILGIPLIFLVAKFLWRRSWNWICFNFNLKFISYGIILGIIMSIIAILLVGLLGDIHIIATPERFNISELIFIILGAVGWVSFISILEEFIFRGVFVREWALKWGWPTAILFGGIYFGIVHIIGLLPNINLIDILWIITASIVANLLFVALYVRSKSLWLPIGFHAGWNLSLNTLLGVVISGKDSSYALLSLETSGQDLITGGMFGIEASLPVMFISIIISIFLFRYSKSGKPNLLSSKFEDNLI